MLKVVSGKARGAVAGLALALASLGLVACGSSSDEDTNYVEQPVEVNSLSFSKKLEVPPYILTFGSLPRVH